jgi:hypothetical protein
MLSISSCTPCVTLSVNKGKMMTGGEHMCENRGITMIDVKTIMIMFEDDKSRTM